LYQLVFYYIWYVYSHGLLQPWHWIAGIAAFGLSAFLIVGLPVRLLRDRNSLYPFDPNEMARFQIMEKMKKLAAT